MLLDLIVVDVTVYAQNQAFNGVDTWASRTSRRIFAKSIKSHSIQVSVPYLRYRPTKIIYVVIKENDQFNPRILMIVNRCFHSPAPSAAPTSVAIVDTSPTTLGLQWTPLDCRHANGEITGYSVSYGEEGSERRKTLTVHGATKASLSLLRSSALYVVSVAAINSAGVGPYSDTIAAPTTSKSSLLQLYGWVNNCPVIPCN